MNRKLRVIELFAGVGGFRIGLQRASKDYEIVWSNQWEPSTKKQDASDIYVKRFGLKGHSNQDISTVSSKEIPDHDILVGGFPCQDYSVARTLNQASGIVGKKGVLWWQIHRIISEKKSKPKYLFLENVDRLLNSPAGDRGRDFAIMLASLSDLGYIVEWRIINAAEYGMPQRRRRIFILAYHRSTSLYKQIKKLKDPMDWILEQGTIAEAFESTAEGLDLPSSFSINGDLAELSKGFNINLKTKSPFENTGIIIDRKVYTVRTKPNYDGPTISLGDIILLNGKVPAEYFINNNAIPQWKYLKGAKKEERTNKKTGFKYAYNEGAMTFPDSLDKPSRTIITGEGGSAPSRFKHVIKTKEGKHRRLTPLELERLNMFPDNHTEGASDIKRAFFMGNALVVGVIEKIGSSLFKKISHDNKKG